MPEGDTIHRAARTLHAALAGQTVTRFVTVSRNSRASIAQSRWRAGRSKAWTPQKKPAHALLRRPPPAHAHAHERLVAHLPSRRTLAEAEQRHAHRDRDGRVGGGRVQRPGRGVSRTRSRSSVRTTSSTSGPTSSRETFDADEAMRRIRERGGLEIADVLLNQRVVSGIGNEYKSGVLFMARVNPFTLVRDVERRAARTILNIARKIMVANVREARRRPRHHVQPRSRHRNTSTDAEATLPEMRNGDRVASRDATCGRPTGVRTASLYNARPWRSSFRTV